MGASRILSAKKHSGKVSKCSDLLYAFQTPAMVRPLLFPGCSLLIQSWFSQHGWAPGLWHAGRDWRKATDLEYGICFSFRNQKKEQLPSSFTQTAEPYCAESNKEQLVTAQGFQPAEKTSFVSTNALSERWVWETGMGVGSVEQS